MWFCFESALILVKVLTLCSQLLWGAPPGEHVGTMLLGQAGDVFILQGSNRRCVALHCMICHLKTRGGSADVTQPTAPNPVISSSSLDGFCVKRTTRSLAVVQIVSPRRALVACNLFAASQCLYQTGVELPAASPVSF